MGCSAQTATAHSSERERYRRPCSAFQTPRGLGVFVRTLRVVSSRCTPRTPLAVCAGAGSAKRGNSLAPPGLCGGCVCL